MNQIAAQLRSMKDRNGAGGVSADQKRVAKRAMLSAIGGDLAAIEGKASLRMKYFLWISQSFISRPVAIGTAAVVLTTSGLMTTVNAAQNSLPGDMLYTVKLINERAQIELASLDRRAVLHTEFAERRLREVEKLQANSSTRNSQLVTDTMNAYTQEVASANQNLRALQASGDAATMATANEVDQNLSTLDSAMQHAETPVVSENGSVALSAAVTTTQAAQEDTIAVAVEAHDQDVSGASVRELQEMFDRQFAALTSREAFDLRRIATIRSSIATHEKELSGLTIISGADLSRLERSITIAMADVAPAMDTFTAGGYRSAFDALQHADNLLRGIEASIAEAETVITDALMNSASDEAGGASTEEEIVPSDPTADAALSVPQSSQSDVGPTP